MAKLGIDVAKVRELHKDKMREVRTPLLAALDVEFMRAVEAGDTAKQAEISTKKQNLRDCTNCVDTYKITSTSLLGVTEQMKQCWEDCLGDNPLL
jgi:hypothetical protein